MPKPLPPGLLLAEDDSDYASQVYALAKAQAVATFDMDGIILSANQDFLDIFGYTLPEIEGRHHAILVDPEEPESKAYRHFWSILGAGQFQAGEYRRLDKAGREIWLQASYNPILGFDGRPFKIIKYATDITAHRRAHAALAGQARAIEKSQAVMEIGLDGTILTANRNFLTPLGYTLEELQGRQHRILVDADELQSAEYRRFWAGLAKGEYQAGEYKRIGKAGAEVWFQATYNPIFDEHGKACKIIKLATDVTAQKLQASEDAGQAKAMARSQAVIEFDLDGYVLSANENYLSILGYTLAEIKGRHHGMFVEPAYRQSAAYGAFWEALRRGEYQVAEFMRFGKDGREVWLQASYNPILDMKDRPRKVVKFATDITARKRAERQLVALEAKFQALHDAPASTRLRLFEGIVVNANDAVLITEAEPWDLPGPRIVYANPAFTAMTGYAPEEVIGKTPRMLQGPMTGTETPAKIKAALMAWQPVQVDILNYHKGGTPFWVELSISPLRDENGWYTHWISVQRDITERKRFEEALRHGAERLALATESGEIGIWEWDLTSGEIVWDQRTRRFYDVNAEAITSGFWSERVHPQDRARVKQALSEAVTENRPFETIFRTVWRDGSVHHIRTTGNVSRDAAGNALRMTDANWDVTSQIAENLALKAATERMQLAADGGEIGILEQDLLNDTMSMDAWACRIFGLPPVPEYREPLETWMQRLHPKDRARRDRARQNAVDGMQPYALEYRIIRADGEIRHLNCAAVVTRDSSGRALRMTGSIQDITERKETAEALSSQRELLEVTLKSIGDAVVCTNMNGDITFSNAAADKLLGIAPGRSKLSLQAEMLRMISACQTDGDASMPEQAMNLPSDYALTCPGGPEIAVEGCIAPIKGPDESEAGKVIVFRDVSAARAIADQVRQMAHHDTLTGLPNRRLLSDRIEQAIAMAPRRGKRIALLFMDLDGFKHINDTLGHEAGDRLLNSVSLRLLDCVRQSDTVSRQGGDEFVMLLAELNEAAEAGITARRILQAVSKPHLVDGHNLYVTASIGISVYPDDGPDAATLLKSADAAMYKVKESGRHGYQFFEAGMKARAAERQYIEESLRRAIKNDEFELHYQPKINIRTGAITGAEALLRWTHPERGAISPAAFIPVAEDCGLIRSLGSWVLRAACEQGRKWMDAGLPPLTIAVNVSPSELGKGDFLEDIRDILSDTGFDPKYLELEMTEGVLMKRAASTDATLKALKAAGLRLAIDDFGTGYSSLSYLTRFPIDTLKIDQSFVRQISTDPPETAIVSAVISMAHSLNLGVVAEGVETQLELDFLSNLGCGEAQGYFFSRPLTAASFAPLLAGGG